MAVSATGARPSGRKPPGQHITPINRPKPGSPASNSELAADSVMPAKPGLIDMAKGNMTTSGTIVGGDNPIAPLSGNNLRPNQQYDGGMGPAVATGGGGGGAYQTIKSLGVGGLVLAAFISWS